MARVLMVDDDPDIRVSIVESLKIAGYEVNGAATGARALAACKEHCPDLVLLDQMLPDLDGLEVCRRLRDDPPTSRVPIVFLTARANEKDRVRGLAAGADDYGVKPFSTAELLLRVRAVLRRSTHVELRLPPLWVRLRESVSGLERVRRASPGAARVAGLPRCLAEHPRQLRGGADLGRADAALRTAVVVRAQPRRRGGVPELARARPQRVRRASAVALLDATRRESGEAHGLALGQQRVRRDVVVEEALHRVVRPVHLQGDELTGEDMAGAGGAVCPASNSVVSSPPGSSTTDAIAGHVGVGRPRAGHARQRAEVDAGVGGDLRP